MYYYFSRITASLIASTVCEKHSARFTTIVIVDTNKKTTMAYNTQL